MFPGNIPFETIQIILNHYYEEDERRRYEADGKPEDRVYPLLRELRNWLSLCGADRPHLPVRKSKQTTEE
jgi:hypothetical protein